MSPEPSAAEPDLRSYLRVLRRRKWIVAFTVVVVVGAALAYSFFQSPRYSATAQVLIQPSSPASTALAGGSQPQLSPTDVQTELQLVTSAAVTAQAARTLHVAKAPPVSVSVAGQTNILDIAATAGTPQLAAGVANAYARSYIGVRHDQIVGSLLAMAGQIQSKINGLQAQVNTAPNKAEATALASQVAAFQAQLSELQVNSSLSNGGALLVTPATAPTSPSSPKPERDGIVALVVGLLAGIALAFLREHFDDTLKTREDLAVALPGLPTIAAIPAVGNWKDRKAPLLVSLDRPKSAAAEAYRTLRTSVQFMGLDAPLRVIQVTSPSAVEGKTTTLANLAVATAQAGQRVVIVCCDLRRPRVHEFFGLSNEYGFTTAMLGEAPLSAVTQDVPDIDRLSILASGPLPPNPADLLASDRARETIAALRSQSDLVLLDCPPVLPVTDAAVLADCADGTLLIASAGSTTRHALARAVESLAQVNAPLLGLVLNGATEDAAYRTSSGYRYGYVYATAGSTPVGNGAKTPQPSV